MGYGKILSVEPGSLAEELELVPGDKIIEVNGMKLRDIIDLSFAFADEEIDMLVEHENGDQEMLEFDKDYDEELGVEFESAVFDGIRKCANNCYFCFVDQVAPGMRETLNIKDDDYRLSFLYGNFVTMTNMVDNDFKRIKQYHLSPLFVSVQCTNPELRCQILRCKTAGNLMTQLDKLEKADVEYHTQIVLCRDLNDGEELDRSIRDILARKPHALSMAIVPVGIMKYRTDPYPLQQFDREGAARVIDMVEKWQKKFQQEEGRTFLYLGDEFYFLAGREVPPTEFYDGFPQLDNGIGLTRSFINDWNLTCQNSDMSNGYDEPFVIDVVTGTSVAPVMEQLAKSLQVKNLQVRIVPVENKHFGSTVNVSGLLTAKDIMDTLQSMPEADKRQALILPEPALRAGEDIFLDDMTLQEFTAHFPSIRVEPVQGGADYYHALTDWSNYHKNRSGETAYTWQSNAGYTKPVE
jgi:putative radical SAM enzyme (TIGR03279 family)